MAVKTAQSARQQAWSPSPAQRPILSGMALLAGLVVAGSLLVEGFFSVQNMRSILLLAAFLGIASLGQTLCALLGGLDLSIPFIIGAANILLPSLMVAGLPAMAAVLVVVALGCIAGLINGLLSYRLQGQALIVSLGFGFAVVGATQIYTSIGTEFGGTVFAQIPEWLRNLYGRPIVLTR
jgi:ribose transport system permease protein